MTPPPAYPPSPRIGELFSGYGGLGMGVQAVYGGTIAWHSDIDKGACKILAHRYPGVPNIGNITTVKWTPDCPSCGEPLALYDKQDSPDGRGYYCPVDGWFDLSIRHNDPDAARIPEPVDILTGGSPCQDLSHAGRRAGMTEGTRSNLWVAMREAIAQLRPATVVWENVRGAFSAAATSELEPCPGCVGDGSGVHLRALGRVLGDLSDLGYDTRWHGLRAADVGAAHGRFRVFVVATHASRGVKLGGVTRSDQRPVPDGDAGGAAAALLPTPSCSDSNGAGSHGDGGLDLRTAVALLPTPTVQDGSNDAGASQFERNSLPLNAAVTLLPTPAVNDMGEGKAVDAWDAWTAKMKSTHGNGNGHGALAPEPTMTSTKGNPQLSPRFVEWLMGLPAGWVTDTPSITRNEALKALGNGVVPQQASEALRVMASWSEVAA